MKKIFSLILSLSFAISFTGCGNIPSNETIPPESSPITTQISEATNSLMPSSGAATESIISVSGPIVDTPTAPELKNNSKVLIAYFSLWGNVNYPDGVDATASASIVAGASDRYGTTEYVARMIQNEVGGILHPIQTKEPYSTNYDEVISQNHDEINKNYLPPLASGGLDISQYDTVFIGYPVWATTAPQAVFSFLSEYDLSGKTVIPFCTHAGYGAGGSYQDIAAVEPQSTILEGISIEAPDVPNASNTVASWLKGLGIGKASSEKTQSTETQITITIGKTVLDGVLYDTALADEIRAKLPLTISMGGYGGREVYGGIDFTPQNVGTGQLSFTNGDITYCGRNNSMAIFYAQTDNPNLTMEIIPIGRVTSDLAAFDELQGNVEVTFSLAK